MAAHMTLHSSKGGLLCIRESMSRSDRYSQVVSWLG